ncbi:hypothetical protein [Parasitella parasitica]|uniref:Uncharacterized protein n=1 Tax=Parasitella parasitica TaxID=35722 RepID=A0A0B7N8J1_9FUNG|nr:hypothetical protein [Parasitella parasitica]
MEAWKWGLIGVGIAFAIVLGIAALYYYCFSPNRRRALSIGRYHDQEQSLETIIEESITPSNSIKNIDKQQLINQQQQEYTSAVQTALSPPRPLVVKNKKTLATSNKIVHENHPNDSEATAGGVSPNQDQRQFSLSPLHITTSEKPSERTLSVCSTSTMGRSMTPMQAQRMSASAWRGPTPPWTEHQSSRRSLRYSS